MKDSENKLPEDEMRDEYDFSGGVRGKYADRLAEGSVVVVLDPDVAEVFSDQQDVNEALRSLAQLIKSREAKKSKVAG